MADDDKKQNEEKTAAKGEPRSEEREEPKDKTTVNEEKTASVKLDKKLTKLAEEIESLSITEAATLAKALQEKFGLAAVPVAATAVSGSATATPAAGEEAVSEQTTFNVVMAASGANKISVIKALREINPQLGLKEAKDIADAPPKEILTGVNRATADEAKGKLEAAGARVELK